MKNEKQKAVSLFLVSAALMLTMAGCDSNSEEKVTPKQSGKPMPHVQQEEQKQPEKPKPIEIDKQSGLQFEITNQHVAKEEDGGMTFVDVVIPKDNISNLKKVAKEMEKRNPQVYVRFFYDRDIAKNFDQAINTPNVEQYLKVYGNLAYVYVTGFEVPNKNVLIDGGYELQPIE
ncbi:MAG: hypothetical protein V4549_03600 [Bacteroidota bacterium]